MNVQFSVYFFFFLQRKADVVTLWLTFPSGVLCVAGSLCGSQDSGCWGALLGRTMEPPGGRIRPQGRKGQGRAL